ncbi:hypothetical protein BH09MYX1_BH09MYX1_31160 [soil metagenome]
MRLAQIALSLSTMTLVSALTTACDDKPAPIAIEASVTTAAATPTASAKPKASVEMPPRPIPKPRTTVGSGDTEEVQLKAIAYMQAMVQPQPDDPILDDAWAKTFATQLEPINKNLDKGAPAQKTKLNRVELVGGGRQVNLYMASGCDAQVPARAAQAASANLTTLHDHGVLVIRCNDARVQCLQSTRDQDDILCTTAPRH